LKSNCKQKEAVDMNKMIEMDNDIEKPGREWASAERRADVPALTSLIADDFVEVGPLGFLLTKQEWLARHQSGDLAYETVDLDDVTPRSRRRLGCL
jgi:hypothetical protein